MRLSFTPVLSILPTQVHNGLSSAGLEPWAASLGGALSAALPASLASQPGDTLLTLLNKRPYESTEDMDVKGKRILGCAREMAILAQELGVRGLFVGWQERLWHVGTIVVVQLLINDAVKHWLGL